MIQQPQVIRDWIKKTSRDPKKMGIELIEANMRLNVARKEGERDAALVAKEGCEHAGIAKIGATLQNVADTLGH